MPFKKKEGEPTKVYSVRLGPTDRDYITARYDSIAGGLRLLTKGGKYEQDVAKMLWLEDELRKISKQ
jgi:hypothetical protein